MKSGRVALSEYTAQRLAELQALRQADEASTMRPSSASANRQTRNYYSQISDDGLGSSRYTSGSSDSNGGGGRGKGGGGGRVGSPPPGGVTRAIQQPSSASEQGRGVVVVDRGTGPIVGIASLALPPDGSYRPVRAPYGRRVGGGGGGERVEIEEREDTDYVVQDTQQRTTYSSTTMNPMPTPVSVGSYPSREPEVRGGGGGQVTEDLKKSLAIKTDSGCIGFATLPDQVHRKAIKRGFDFNLMVVGESGLGKSTLISSMFFQNELYDDRRALSADERIFKTTTIEKRHLEIEEHGVRLRVTVIDTPGFNDAIDSSDCWKPIDKYIQDQHNQYFKDESGLSRQAITDNRVHCCLYFVSPHGRGLRQTDAEFIRRLQNKVNIVPIIAKADVLTPNELRNLKVAVTKDISRLNLRIYELPPLDNDEDDDCRLQDREIKRAFPFAVIGGNAMVEVNGNRIKGRVYPWGIVEAENPNYSDAALLRLFLVSTHLHDLKEVTKDVHYENFRASVINPKANTLPPLHGTTTSDDPDKLLKEKEAEIKRMHQLLMKMQSQMYVGQVR